MNVALIVAYLLAAGMDSAAGIYDITKGQPGLAAIMFFAAACFIFAAGCRIYLTRRN